MTENEGKNNRMRAWVGPLARFGYAAKGVVYLLVGVLAARAAFEAGRAPGKKGALQMLLNVPFGQVLFGLVALGLIAYVLWRFTQAGLDTEGEGTSAEGIVKRLGFTASGFVYLALAVFTTARLFGAPGSSNGEGQGGAQEAAQGLMTQPYGQVLVGAGGLVIIGVGIYQFYRAYKAAFHVNLKGEHAWLVGLGRLGFAARGVVYLLIGSFFALAALNHNAARAGGLGQALRTLEKQPFGPWLLGTVALGLATYGLYAIFLAHYRQIGVKAS